MLKKLVGSVIGTAIGTGVGILIFNLSGEMTIAIICAVVVGRISYIAESRFIKWN